MLKHFLSGYNPIRIFKITLLIPVFFLLLPLALSGSGMAGRSMVPIFPGAEGFGSYTVAGSGRHLFPSKTQIYKVINLDDAGYGSLRYALEASGPRTVLFEIGGIIHLKKEIVISNPYITIAGQTAPRPGITLKNYGIIVENTHDVLIQHIAIRIGDLKKKSIDGVSINSRGLPTYNVVMDHISVSWWTDGGIDFYSKNVVGSDLHDISVSNCIISEGLNYDNHALATAVGPGCKNISFIKNLYAHNQSRNPLISGNTSVLIVNNLVYNSAYYGPVLTNSRESGPHCITIQGCVVIPGYDTKNAEDGLRILSNVSGLSKIFSTDLIAMNNSNLWPGVRNDTKIKSLRSEAPPINIRPLTILSSKIVKRWLIEHAGSRPWDRDQIDSRILNDVQNKTGRIINSQFEIGGWLDVNSENISLTLPDDPDKDDNKNGYTNLEEYIHSLLF